MKTHETYADNNATTMCAQSVVDSMLPYLTQTYGNPSSPHEYGRRAAKALEEARGRIAAYLGSESREILFTSGATESNNLAITGIVGALTERTRIVASPIEHKSVIEPLRLLVQGGYEVVYLRVNASGAVDLDSARDAIDEQTALVSVQGANNETGVLQPVKEIAEIAHDRGALVHSDVAQMLGKVSFSLQDMGADLASFSAHKAYGPKGIGCLFIGARVSRSLISPLLRGGEQERGLRPGTVNVAAAVGFAEACRLCQVNCDRDERRIGNIRDMFEEKLAQRLPQVQFNGVSTKRLPGTCSVTVPGILGDMLVTGMGRVCIGNGSACTSGAPSPSHVLLAMGMEREMAESSVRISFGRYNVAEDADIVARAMSESVERIDPSLRAPASGSRHQGVNA